MGETPSKNHRTKQEAITVNLGSAFTANYAIVRPTARVRLALCKVDKKGDRTELFDHPVLDPLTRPNGSLIAKPDALSPLQQYELHW